MIHTSVIIPTLHSPWLAQIVDALHAQEYDLSGTEVLIIGFDHAATALQDTLIRYIPVGGPTPPAKARNIGIRMAQGKLICFLDSDCIPTPSWLASITQPYRSMDVHVVGGTITFPQDYWTLCDTVAHFNPVIAGARRKVGKAIDMPEPIDSAAIESTTVIHLPTLNFSARREVFEEVGLFDEAFLRPSGEDTELTKRMLRQGFQLHVAENAVLFHAATRRSLVDLLRRSYHHGQAAQVPSYRQQLLEESSLFGRRLLLLTAPLRALVVTIQIYWRYPGLRRFWRTFPVVYLIKLTWGLSIFMALSQARRVSPLHEHSSV